MARFLFCIFHSLSFELNFFFDRRYLLTYNQLYLISALVRTFYKDTANKFLKFAYNLGHFHIAVAPILN